MYRLEIIDKNGTHEEKIGSSQYIDLASNKSDGERVELLEKAIYAGCEDLEIFYEVIKWHMDKTGQFRKAYSLACLAPASRKIPSTAKNHDVYKWLFNAYWALSAQSCGYNDEAVKIQQDLIYNNSHTMSAMGWLSQNYKYYLQSINSGPAITTFMNAKKKENSRVAILFIGRYRTFDRTYYNIWKNLIVPNNATAFIFCECDKTELHKNAMEKWNEETVGGCSTTNGRPAEFNHITRYLFNTKSSLLPEKFNNSARPTYILQSGSILEYYYYSKCYDLMLAYEKIHNVKFDIIVRMRLDIMVGPTLNLVDFFDGTGEKRENDDMHVRSLGNHKIASMIKSRHNDPINDLQKKINSEKYVWTFGPNQIWIGKRYVMSQFYSLIYLYGKYDSGKVSTFNSETQFDMFCKERNIEHFIISTKGGGKYLCSKKLNSSLLKNAKDPIEDTEIMWTFIRMPWFGFPKS